MVHLQTQQADQNLGLSAQPDQNKSSVPLKTIQRYFVQSSLCSGGYLAHRFQRISDIKHEDTIFVSIYALNIDFEEFAISVFDTRDLRSHTLEENEGYSCIKSTKFHTTYSALGKSKIKDSHYIEKRYIPSLLNNIFCTGSPDPKVKDERRVILITWPNRFDLLTACSKLGPLIKVPAVDPMALWGECFRNLPQISMKAWSKMMLQFIDDDCVWNTELAIKFLLKLIQGVDDFQMEAEGG